MAQSGHIEASVRLSAFGAKRTCALVWLRRPRPLMTQSRHRGDRNPGSAAGSCRFELCYLSVGSTGGIRAVKRTRYAAFLREVLMNEKTPALEIVDEDRGRDGDR